VSNTLADIDGLGTISYKWRANGNNISGVTGSSYKLTQAEVGKAITVVASYTDQLGSAESVVSQATVLVAKVNDVSNGSYFNMTSTSFTGTARADWVMGTAFSDSINGAAGDDNIKGNAGNDFLKGGLGKDMLDGGSGVDTLDYSDKTAVVSIFLFGSFNTSVYVNNVLEDTIKNIENITGGSGADFLNGDSFANLIKGNAGNDVIKGGLGKDTLIGGAGADLFLFDTNLSSSNTDTVKDFTKGYDELLLDDDVFLQFAGKFVLSDHLRVGAKPLDLNDFLIYNISNDMLYYDADGSGSRYGMLEVAKIELAGTNAPTYLDFLVGT
jgi:Ca2+-binding RTX toxin-like protein